MTNATAPGNAGYTMTLRVYTVTREGLITEDHGTQEATPAQELPDGPNGYPPCGCARHRVEGAAAAR